MLVELANMIPKFTWKIKLFTRAKKLWKGVIGDGNLAGYVLQPTRELLQLKRCGLLGHTRTHSRSPS